MATDLDLNINNNSYNYRTSAGAGVSNSLSATDKAADREELKSSKGASTYASRDDEYLGKAPKKADANKIMLNFKSHENYQLVSAKSEMEDVDVEKAMSDMKKDFILSQYKYFVNIGDDGNLGTDLDGTVKIKK